jgi:hypothetical protein
MSRLWRLVRPFRAERVGALVRGRRPRLRWLMPSAWPGRDGGKVGGRVERREAEDNGRRSRQVGIPTAAEADGVV